MQAPVMILNTSADREVGNKAQMGNIAACKVRFYNNIKIHIKYKKS